MDKAAELAKIEAAIAADGSLPLRGANLVFGEGNPEATVLFVGEAPGMHEDMQRRPFVGRAGQLLRQMIREIGWREADVYITNIVKRRPPENRDPLPEEIAAYAPYLKRQLEILGPRVVVPLGRFAMNYFLPAAKITRDQGKVFRMPARQGSESEGGSSYCVVPLFHPAAALRSPETMDALRTSFQKLPQIVRQCENLPSATPPAAEKPQPAQKKLF